MSIGAEEGMERRCTMADGERKVLCSPSSGDRVNVAATDSTSFGLDVNVVIFKWL
jgi:hypothetical protein